MAKVRRNITVDENVWELAKQKISEPLSCYIQTQLEIACSLNNEKAKIEKQLHEKEQEISALRSQLCKIEREERLSKKNVDKYEKCMPPILRILDKAGCVGENQITSIANNHKVNHNDLIKYCKSQNLNVVELFEFEHEGKSFNGGRL